MEKEIFLASQLVALLRERKLTFSTAESCTGGLISAAITAVPDASDIFHYGFITYGEDAKGKILQIDPIILKCGTVSPEVAEAMATGAKGVSGSDIALSITGYAGPGGGTKLAPVGTAFIAIVGSDVTELIRRQYKGSREQIRREFTLQALQLAIEYINRLKGEER
ncbi:MAG: hypothetical protein A3F16_04225 [Deltaproteobacteria bacterium RIFCSPHIGHO2_12_FULL_43_9]|nr:MAG: hypothetical protein A3F16_04225 [Deltaproteobacteria bacterium RIFCSPHIGHO2_12_FULL_43_9]